MNDRFTRRIRRPRCRATGGIIPSDEDSDASEIQDDMFGAASLMQPKRPKLLGTLLYELVQDSEHESAADLTVIVGPKRVSVPGHQAVFSVMSEVFLTQLKPCWNEGTDGEEEGGQDKKPRVIQLPEDISEKSAKTFIKYLYKEELEVPEMTSAPDEVKPEEVLLEVMALADMYLVKELLAMCDELLTFKINRENCVAIFEKTKRFSTVTKVGSRAYQFLKKGIRSMINDIILANDSCNWAVDTWKALLQEEYLIVSEIDLFKALLIWKDVDETRFDEFNELVYLIRYPLMKQADFSKYVATSKALTLEDLVEIFMLYNGDGTEQTKFNCNARRRKFATTSSKLKKFLAEAKPEDIIILSNYVYEGIFILDVSNISIIGAENSVLEADSSTHLGPVIAINANNCKLENVTILTTRAKYARTTIVIHGSSNSLKNVEISVKASDPEHSTMADDTLDDSIDIDSISVISVSDDTDSDDDDYCSLEARTRKYGYFGCAIEGHGNILSQIVINGHARGVLINGESNQLSHVKISDCDVGICTIQSRNQISSLSMKNVQTGIDLQGYNNRVKNVEFDYPPVIKGDKSGVQVRAVSVMGHTQSIEDVVCVGLEQSNVRWSIYMANHTSNAKVKNCGPGQVTVQGDRNKFENVKASGCLRIAGGGHSFDRCVGDTLALGAGLRKEDFEFTSCNFRCEF